MAPFGSTEELWQELERRELTGLYSKFLQNAWGPRTPLEAIRPFAEVARRAAARPQLIVPLIEDPNWRINLHGVALAVLALAVPLLSVFTKRLTDGCWAAPQLAAGMLVLCSEAGATESAVHVTELERLVRAATPEADPKTLMSAYAVLRHSSRQSVSAFESSEPFRAFWVNGGGWYDLAMRHYHFWRVLLPHFLSDRENG